MARHPGDMCKGYRERTGQAITPRPSGPAFRAAGIIEAMTEDKTRLLKSLAIDRSASAAAHVPGGGARWLLAAVAGFVVIAALVVTVFGLPEFRGLRGAEPAVAQSPVDAAPPPPPQQTANRKDAGTLAASGYVVARRKATVAAEITGKVMEVLIEEGMTVTEGQVVARLDSVLAESDLALARSRVEAADAAIGAVTADLKDATLILSRVQTLAQKNYATDADHTKAQARVGVLTAQLRQAQSQRDSARLDAERSASVLDKYKIRAPFSGVVVDRSAQPGEMISPMSVGGFTRTGICTIVDMDSIEVEVDVNEAFIGRVVAGGKVNAVLDAYPDWSIPASVIAIVPTANREKATVRVRIRFEQKDPRILPDMAVKVTFIRDANAGALAPNATASAN
ncbi:efflux RND transporter periplasmic adaptor subunit [Bradyrhizobium sediminis]|uniref:Efflux RND transporter periplasmic adaptor subunit n=1 Tax=Bradyrhizobium sediminis TaxID=2840469 RepID=A0A975NW69_9BRAD|nr:efflux RND transporter periplasmic adaptor subunit [Bradyrhizobium sediminis]QWG21786.1 efflux RND transporter periplasmic adaptor subunit [Bradyrhizobium sediminis]